MLVHGRNLDEGGAAPSPEPEGSDIVEAYSLSTGTFDADLSSQHMLWVLGNTAWPFHRSQAVYPSSSNNKALQCRPDGTSYDHLELLWPSSRSQASRSPSRLYALVHQAGAWQEQLRVSQICRTKYMGEGSAACALGLMTGLGILITQRYFTEEVLHKLLTFNPADFFT